VIAIVFLGVALLAVLVWAGRRGRPLGGDLRIAAALFSVAAAVGAVVVGLRGAWPVSVALILASAYMGQTARVRSRPNQGAPPESMSRRQARSILGVGDTAGRAEIEAAYRRLIRRAHPDHGGSTGLAAQLNAARDRLLRGG